MQSVKRDIQIVKYHEGLAAGIAKMWNLSRDSWGGDTRVMTEEQVKTKEENSENIELYLALDNNEVVGYCGLSEYKEDTGSLYIPLLNVLPAYHGKKIGKMLVMKALEKTIELGTPRLDLYTWPGNTKAVPLYKKCGFFWEDRDDITHLMNFIPQILNTPLLKPLFEKIDWYATSTRKIDVKPDGTKENGFTFYEYRWETNNTCARIQFERTGRGINLIETDEFLLQLLMNDHEVIEEIEQEFHLKIVNKTKSPLSFKANGSGTDRVIYALNTSEISVENETIISNNFIVRKGEEPSVFRTHPSLSVNISINGQDCELKLGVFPMQPAKIEAYSEPQISFLNRQTQIYLELRNNLPIEAVYIVNFPKDDQVTLEQSEFKLSVPAKGRQTVAVPLEVKQHGFYHPILKVRTVTTSGKTLSFDQEVSIAFRGEGQKFGGESKLYWHIYNGLGQLNVRKLDLNVKFTKNAVNRFFSFLAPKLGKPYTNEFNKKKPSAVSWNVTDSSVILNIKLESSEFPDLYLTQCFELFGDAIVQQWAEVKNNAKNDYQDVAVCQPVYQELGDTQFPLNGRVVFFSKSRPLEFGDLNPASITENWYFTKTKEETLGLSWPINSKVAPDGWQFVIEQKIGTLRCGEKQIVGKTTVAIDAFQEFDSFRAFALQAPIDKKEGIPELNLKTKSIIAKANSPQEFTLTAYRNSYLDGELKLTCNDKPLCTKTIACSEEKTELSFEEEIVNSQQVSVLSAEFHQPAMHTKLEELLLFPNGTVSTEIKTNGSTIVNNGILTIKSDPNFYPGIYSLEVNGEEWLASEYPSLTAKSWWNPWAGGMKWSPSGVTTFSLLKEKSSVSSAELCDKAGNRWHGMAVHTEFSEHPEWKHVQYAQYYLMLPGVPVLATFLEVTNDGGKWIPDVKWLTDFFLGGETLGNLSIKSDHLYRAGKQELPMFLDEASYIQSDASKEKLYIVPSLYAEPTEAYTNKEAFELVSAQSGYLKGDNRRTAPLFFLFDERSLSKDVVKKLRRIHF